MNYKFYAFKTPLVAFTGVFFLHQIEKKSLRNLKNRGKILKRNEEFYKEYYIYSFYI